MKKILAVATAIVLAISSLCVFVFADSSNTITIDGVTYDILYEVSDAGTSGGGDSNFSFTFFEYTYDNDYSEWEALAESGAVIYFQYDATAAPSWTQLRIQYRKDGSFNYYDDYYPSLVAGTDQTCMVSASNFTSTTYYTDDSYLYCALVLQGDKSATVTVDYFAILVPSSTSAGSTVLHTATQSDMSSYSINYSDYLTSYTNGDEVTITVTLETDDADSSGCVSASDYNSNWVQTSYGYNGTVAWTQSGSIYTATVSIDVAIYSSSASVQFWWVNGSYINVTSVSVTAAGAVPATESASRTNGVIYINEDYHGILLTRSLDGGETSKTYLACVPHTVASNGYCTVCHMYIGTDDEGSTVTIDGIEYEAAFSNDVNLASSNWNKVSLGDSSFAAALSTEGALLVITRDSESTISYVSGEAYEKFMIGKDDSNHVDLATLGTTTEDEDGLVGYISDDGTTVVYDGATVYAALEAAGMADLDSYVIISNTSGSYTITNVSVYVPAGTIVAEDVDVEEPVESTDTETEDDGDDLTVDDTDEVETPAETNPTTGVALALVPMAIAGIAVVSSKRR